MKEGWQYSDACEKAGYNHSRRSITKEENAERNLAVGGFAGDELAVVEADAIVQQQGYVLRHQLAGMAVDATFQLCLDIAEDAVQLLALTLRYVQGLVDRIAEEGVGQHLYALHQRRRKDKHHALVALFE